MWHFTAAAPADVIESAAVSETEISTESTSTLLPETMEAFDYHQNEVDTVADVKTTTMSDIDDKIVSINSDSQERSIVGSIAFEEDISTQIAVKLMEELQEAATPELTASEMLVTEMSSNIETTTTESLEFAQPEEEVEAKVIEVQKSTENKKIETGVEDEEPELTTLEVTTDKTLQESSTSAVAVMNETDSSELAARRNILIEIRKVLRAHMLRTVLTLLNESKKRQTVKAPEQHAMESQIIEQTVPAVYESECDCGERDDVSTNDENKIIAFDQDLQRYVYMDKADFEQEHVRYT